MAASMSVRCRAKFTSARAGAIQAANASTPASSHRFERPSLRFPMAGITEITLSTTGEA
jgi:hypothetical protein